MPEIAATDLGVLTNALAVGLDALDPAVVARSRRTHPRGDFMNEFLQTFHEGLKHRPDTTYGTINADVLEHFMPGFRRGSMVARVQDAPYPS